LLFGFGEGVVVLNVALEVFQACSQFHAPGAEFVLIQLCFNIFRLVVKAQRMSDDDQRIRIVRVTEVSGGVSGGACHEALFGLSVMRVISAGP
jgi:hypothetical protein